MMHVIRGSMFGHSLRLVSHVVVVVAASVDVVVLEGAFVSWMFDPKAWNYCASTALWQTHTLGYDGNLGWSATSEVCDLRRLRCRAQNLTPTV